MNSELWMPHAHCVLYDLRLILLSLVGNILTATAYFLIPFFLGMGTWRLRSLLHKSEQGLFFHGAVFIGFCGSTHVMEAWNWFHHNYWIEAIIVLATGLISVSFVFRLRRFIKRRFEHP